MNRELSVLVWGLVVLAAVAVLGLVAWCTRRWLHAERSTEDAPVFTLQDLREMRESGSLSEAEYQRIRAGALAGLGAGRQASHDEPGSDRASA